MLEIWDWSVSRMFPSDSSDGRVRSRVFCLACRKSSPCLQSMFVYIYISSCKKTSHTGLVVNNLSANAEDTGDVGSVPGSGRSPREENGYLENSCLENPMDRGAWWATVHGVAKSQICLSNWAYWIKAYPKNLILSNYPYKGLFF